MGGAACRTLDTLRVYLSRKNLSRPLRKQLVVGRALVLSERLRFASSVDKPFLLIVRIAKLTPQQVRFLYKTDHPCRL